MIEGIRKTIKNDEGLTLVELIVVMAIMAVMIGGSVAMFQLLSSSEAKRGAYNLQAQLNDIKTGSMTKAGEELEIIKNATVSEDASKTGLDKVGYYVKKSAYTIANANDIKVSESDTDAEYSYLCSASVTVEDSEGNDSLEGIGITFDRRTGEVLINSNRISRGGEYWISFKHGLHSYKLTLKSGSSEIVIIKE